MYSASFTQHNPIYYNPIKKLEHIPIEIDIREKGYGGISPLSMWITKQANRQLPFVVSIKLKINCKPEIHSRIQRTGQVFYFVINNIFEDDFKYLGHSQEKDKKKNDFLNTFFVANNGCGEAQTELADRYTDGNGVKANLKQAFRYYSLSAVQGNLKAQTILAKCMTNGIFITQNRPAAVEIFRILADNHQYPDAQYQLASHLGQGLGVSKNIKESLRYCKLAAKKNHIGAIFALTIFYSDIKNEKKDYSEAIKLIDQLANLKLCGNLSQERISEWITTLPSPLPGPFEASVIHLYEKISKAL